MSDKIKRAAEQAVKLAAKMRAKGIPINRKTVKQLKRIRQRMLDPFNIDIGRRI